MVRAMMLEFAVPFRFHDMQCGSLHSLPRPRVECQKSRAIVEPAGILGLKPKPGNGPTSGK